MEKIFWDSMALEKVGGTNALYQSKGLFDFRMHQNELLNPFCVLMIVHTDV